MQAQSDLEPRLDTKAPGSANSGCAGRGAVRRAAAAGCSARCRTPAVMVT